MLAGQDTTQRLTELMAHRAPLYRGAAAITVQTDGRRVRDVAEEILREVDRILPP